MEKKAELTVEYDTRQGCIWIWNGGCMIASEDFDGMTPSQKRDIEKFFGRKFKFKARKM